MSKHLGNVLEPVPLMDQHGADAVRWFMLAGGSPWQARRVGHQAIEEVARKTLLTYWNTVSFQSLYARAAGWSPDSVGQAPAAAQRPSLDRWVLSQAHSMISEVTASMENFDTQRAGKVLASFVDELSNWYVRRSRRRFWQGDPAALATLHEALRLITLAMAPFTPFITERVWQDLFAVVPGETDSVHLAIWPDTDGSLIDDRLREDVAMVRRVVELGRAARAGSAVRNRQPLSEALVSSPRWADLPDDLRREIAEELNVVEVKSLAEAAGDLVDLSVKANFRSLGRRFAKQTPVVAKAIAAAPAQDLVTAVREFGAYPMTVEGIGEIQVTTEDIIVTETPREGWTVASDAGETVALDLHLTDELLRAGIAREVIRFIQESRKSAGLDVTDRIDLRWQSGDESVVDAIREHADLISDEVLAIGFEAGDGAEAGHRASLDSPDLTVWIQRS